MLVICLLCPKCISITFRLRLTFHLYVRERILKLSGVGQAVLKYCKETQIKCTSLQEETQNFSEDLSDVPY